MSSKRSKKKRNKQKAAAACHEAAVKNIAADSSKPEEESAEDAAVVIAEPEEESVEDAAVVIAEPEEESVEDVAVVIAEPEEELVEDAAVVIAEPEEESVDEAVAYITELVKAKEREHVSEKKENKTENTDAKKKQVSAKPLTEAEPKAKPPKEKQQKVKKPSFFAKTDRKKLIIVSVSFAVLVVIICIAAISNFNRYKIPESAIASYSGRNASDSYCYELTEDLATQYEFAKNTKRKGDTDLFRYFASDGMVLPEPTSYGRMSFANVFDNNCALIVSLVDSAGKLYYRSSGLLPNKALSDIRLADPTLPYGIYDLKMVVCAFDLETYELIGTQYSDFTLQIGIEEETTSNEEYEETSETGQKQAK